MEKPKLNPNITVIRQTSGRVLLLNQRTNQSHSIGPKEYKVLQLCDGEHEIEQICTAGIGFPKQTTRRLLEKFRELGFFNQEKEKRRQKILNVKLGIIHPKKQMDKEHPIFHILGNILLFCSVTFFVLGIVLCLVRQPEPVRHLHISTLSYFLILCISMALHEVAHAVMALRNKAYVSEMGISLKVILPCLYTSIVGVDKISEKRKRMQIYGAGILMNLLLVGIGSVGKAFADGMMMEYFSCLVSVNFLLIFINLLIFIPLDGMFLLGEFIGDRNFNKNATVYFVYRINSLLYRVSKGKINIGQKNLASLNQKLVEERKQRLNELPWKLKAFYLVHGLGCFLVSVFTVVQMIRMILTII